MYIISDNHIQVQLFSARSESTYVQFGQAHLSKPAALSAE
jgi:hypothetical protein